MKKNFDGAAKKADPEAVSAAVFESEDGARTDTALKFTPEFAVLFNGNAAARAQGMQAFDLIVAGVDPDVAITGAYENLSLAYQRKMMN